MSDRSAGSDAAQLAALRARLYAQDTTPIDRARYDAFLAHTLGAPVAGPADPDPDPDPDPDDDVPEARAAPPAAGPRRRGLLPPGPFLVTVLLALAVGAATGVAVSTRGAERIPVATTSASPIAAATSPVVPTPIAAAPLFGSAAEQDASASALVKALAVKDGEARSSSLSTVGIDAGPHGDAAWSRAVGCADYTGDGNVSIDGSASGFFTSAGETGARPTGTRFRLKIHLTRAADWSWIAYGTRTGSDAEIVAVGAGAATSGPAQYAEFTERDTTVITAIRVFSSGKAPFIWQLQSCTPR